MEKTVQNTKRKRAMLLAVIVVSIGGTVFALHSMIIMWREKQAAIERQKAIAELAAKDTYSPAPVDTPSPTMFVIARAPQPEPGRIDGYALEPDRAIDFEALKQINADVYAWISVPGTSIDYPVVHAPKGNEFYIAYDIEGNKSKYGAIFTDGYNNIGFIDPMTVVYGHNMKDGSMFASLHNFEDAAFFDANTIIRVYMEDYMLEYEIFAAYKTGDAHLLAIHDFFDEKVFADYVEGVFSIRDINAKLRRIEIAATDRVITLATCVEGEDEARYLVQGVLKSNG